MRFRGCSLLLPEAADDDLVYLTTAQAAEAFGVTTAAIRRWVKLKYLKPVVKDERTGRALYEFTQVARAERQAYENALRTSGSDTRVIRKIPA